MQYEIKECKPKQRLLIFTTSLKLDDPAMLAVAVLLTLLHAMQCDTWDICRYIARPNPTVNVNKLNHHCKGSQVRTVRPRGIMVPRSGHDSGTPGRGLGVALAWPSMYKSTLSKYKSILSNYKSLPSKYKSVLEVPKVHFQIAKR